MRKPLVFRRGINSHSEGRWVSWWDAIGAATPGDTARDACDSDGFRFKPRVLRELRGADVSARSLLSNTVNRSVRDPRGTKWSDRR